MYLKATAKVLVAVLAGHGVIAECLFPESTHPFTLAPGWKAEKVTDGLTSPRGIVVDAEGRLLIVERGIGITQHTLIPRTRCVDHSILVRDPKLTHGIYLDPSERFLYASSASSVFFWRYNQTSGKIRKETRQTLVKGMATSGHVTRTLAVPDHETHLLVVSHGSMADVDLSNDPLLSTSAAIKVFEITAAPVGGYSWARDGQIVGYGLRDEVGLAFDGNNMLWDVEQGTHNLTDGTSEYEPAEELNFLGDVTKPKAQWYGYPYCHTVSQPFNFSGRAYRPGDQFAVSRSFMDITDDTCTFLSHPASLTFPAHTTPLDAKFDANSTNLFVALHGNEYDSDRSTGYEVVAIAFSRQGDGNYAPVANVSDPQGYVKIFSSPNETNCSSATCVRPVGLAFDRSGKRLYMTSDTSGEVFMLHSNASRLTW